MSILIPKHPCRIYRTYGERKHDLSVVLQELDIYGEDKWGRMTADTTELILQPELMTDAPMTIFFEPDVDVEAGYIIEVKKTMYYDGRLVTVETTLSAAAFAGDTTLTVARAWGFSSGDIILLSSGGNYERTKLRSVDTTTKTLTLYEDLALENDWDVGAAVRASQWFEVLTVRHSSRVIAATCQRIQPRAL